MLVGCIMTGKFAHSELFGKADVRCERDDFSEACSHTANMSDQVVFGRNLKSARKAAGLTQEQLADAADTSKGYISDLEGGKRPIPPGAMLQRLTTALSVSVGDLVGKSDVDRRQIPVISWVAAGQLATPDTQLPQENETIEISGLPPGDYFGTKARGDSMNRVAPDDSLLIVNRADRELVRGRRYIFASRGKTTFKRFGGTDPYRLEPESWNPANEPIYPRDGEVWEVIGRVTMVVAEI